MSDRGRSASRSRSPGRRGGGRRGDGVSLLVRNLPLDTRPDEIRQLFEKYGKIFDVYLPRDHYTRRPKGFGFVEMADSRDAEEAIYNLDRVMFGGRELQVCRAREQRKKPDEMRSRDSRGRRGGERGGGRRRSRSRSRSRSRGRGRRDYSRSRSRDRGGRRERRRSASRSRSPRSRSPSPKRDRSPNSPHMRGGDDQGNDNGRERSRSPPLPGHDDGQRQDAAGEPAE